MGEFESRTYKRKQFSFLSTRNTSSFPVQNLASVLSLVCKSDIVEVYRNLPNPFLWKETSFGVDMYRNNITYINNFIIINQCPERAGHYRSPLPVSKTSIYKSYTPSLRHIYTHTHPYIYIYIYTHIYIYIYAYMYTVCCWLWFDTVSFNHSLLVRQWYEWQRNDVGDIQQDAECRIYASVKWAIISSDNGLSPCRCQAII